MAKKNANFDSLFKKEVRDAVKKHLDEAEDEGILDNEFVKEDPVISGVFSSFPSSEGYYGKVYKQQPDGGWEIKDYIIEAPEIIQDLELEVKNIVLDKDWGEGTYYVQIRSEGRRGFAKTKKVIVGTPTLVEREERETRKKRLSSHYLPQQQVDPTEAASRVIDKAISVAKNMIPAQPTNQTDIGKVMEAMSGFQKTNFDTVLQAVKSQGPQVDSSSVALQVITVLKEAGFFRQPDKVDEISILTKLKDFGVIGEKRDEGEVIDKVITRLQSLGVIGGQKEDQLGSLVKLKETMGMKFPWETKQEGAMDSIEKVGSIISAIRPLVNPEAGPPSTLQLVFEAIAKFGEPLFNTLRDIAESKKLEMQYRLEATGRIPPSSSPQVRYQQRQEQRPPIQPPPAPPNQQQPGQQPRGGNGSPMNPIFAKVVDIVEKKDVSQFDWLRQTILYKLGAFGQNYLENLMNGQLTIDYLMSSLVSEYESILKTFGVYQLAMNPGTKEYFGKFVDWMKEQYGIQEVKAKCDKCGEGYTFDNVNDWNEDGKSCDSDNCSGKIQIVSSRESPAPPTQPAPPPK